MSVLELEDISKSFGGIRAVNKVSLGFENGKITALLGPNGAGKTTVFNLISGFIKPDSGKIFYNGIDITRLPPWRIAEIGIGRLFQDVRVFGRMTVLNNVMVGFKNQIGRNPLVSAFMPWKVRKEEKYYTSKAIKLLDFVGLSDKANELAENLSYGQQKLLSIARLLAQEANVLLLDEPTAGVNPSMITILLDVIKNIAKQGKTVVIIEHNMNVVLKIADWVYFMNEGEVISFGLPSEVLNDPDVRATYIGI